MTDSERVVRWFLVGLLFLSAVPNGVAAQDDGPPRVLFDQSVTEVATLQTANHTYVVYRYDNLFPYAGGIEIVEDGRIVTDRETADEVFQELAQRQGTKFQPIDETIAEVKRVRARSRAIQNATDQAAAALDQAAAVRAQLENTTVNGTEAWDVVTDRADGIDSAYTGRFTTPPAESLREELASTRSAASAVEADATRVIQALRRSADEQSEANQSALYRSYRQLYREIGQMERSFGRTRDLMSRTAALSREGAQQAQDIEEVGGMVEREFSDIASQLEAAESTIGSAATAIDELQGPLPPVTTDEAYQQELTDAWNSRRGADTVVKASVGEIAIVALAAVLALFKS